VERNIGHSSETILVVPCYNEAKRLDLAKFRASATENRGLRFLFVNDGSTDDTSAVLRELHESRPETFLTHELPQNGGKAEAVRQGFLQALELSPTYVGFWDADLSAPLDEVDGMLAIFRNSPQIEMVFGARVNLLGREVRRKLYRHYLGRVFATMVARALGLGIYDTQCGAKLFRVNDYLPKFFQEAFISKWIFDVEIIARSIQLRRAAKLAPVSEIIYEQPLMNWNDVAGSKLRFRDFFVVYGDFLRIYHRYMWRNR
jgi:dolichyl-phosphate beta-glucosyltransferase